MEAECNDVAEAADAAPFPARADGKRRVLDDPQAVAIGNEVQAFHVDRQAGKVRRNHGPRARRHRCENLVDIDLDQVLAAVTPRTRAVVPTHFAGLPVDMERLHFIANRHRLRVIEDAALAIGSRWNGRRIGSFGDIVAFSFHPNKNITTIEGGALVLSDEAEAKLAEKLRFHGIVRLIDGTRDVDIAGGKFNMSDVSARIGLAQLAQLETFNARRRELAEHYFSRLEGHACVLPARAAPGDEQGHSWSMFCVRLPLERMSISRKQVMEAMHAVGIGTGISYEALHLTTLGRRLGYSEGMLPNAERIARETLTLPLFTQMTGADVDRVCDALMIILDRACD